MSDIFQSFPKCRSYLYDEESKSNLKEVSLLEEYFYTKLNKFSVVIPVGLPNDASKYEMVSFDHLITTIFESIIVDKRSVLDLIDAEKSQEVNTNISYCNIPEIFKYFETNLLELGFTILQIEMALIIFNRTYQSIKSNNPNRDILMIVANLIIFIVVSISEPNYNIQFEVSNETIDRDQMESLVKIICQICSESPLICVSSYFLSMPVIKNFDRDLSKFQHAYEKFKIYKKVRNTVDILLSFILQSPDFMFFEKYKIAFVICMVSRSLFDLNPFKNGVKVMYGFSSSKFSKLYQDVLRWFYVKSVKKDLSYNPLYITEGTFAN